MPQHINQLSRPRPLPLAAVTLVDAVFRQHFGIWGKRKVEDSARAQLAACRSQVLELSAKLLAAAATSSAFSADSKVAPLAITQLLYPLLTELGEEFAKDLAAMEAGVSQPGGMQDPWWEIRLLPAETEPENPSEQPRIRKSSWLEWWRDEFVEQVGSLPQPRRPAPPAWGMLDRHLADRSAFMSCSPAVWWDFWMATWSEMLTKDARYAVLIQVMVRRRAYADLLGVDWLSGGRLLPKGPSLGYAGSGLVGGTGAYPVWYKAMCQEHLLSLEALWPSLFDVGALLAAVHPERDAWLDAAGWQHLLAGGGLHPLPHRVWVLPDGKKESTEVACEPPQWAWLRLALFAALGEPEDQLQKRGALTKKAIEWYNLFSTLTLLPSDAALRQAGVSTGRFLEDSAARVSDDFESAMQSVYLATINTKWTGTVSLDWSAVRSAGAAVAGTRLSQGPLAFVSAIDNNLATQGRSDQARPVTVSLPIWHREIEDWIEYSALREGEVKKDEVPEFDWQNGTITPTKAKKPGDWVQTVVRIPDIFMRRLRQDGYWYLLDPGEFPMLADRVIPAESLPESCSPEDAPEDVAYLATEALVMSRHDIPHRAARRVRARVIWKKLLLAVHRRGAPNILFSGPADAFEPFPVSFPWQHGIDGVGALPLGITPEPEIDAKQSEGITPWIVWPAAVVNIYALMGVDGTFAFDQLNHAVNMGLRFLDNMFSLGMGKHLGVLSNRSVCLGAIGIAESRSFLSGLATSEAASQWFATLTEAWGLAVLSSDQALLKERGAAPAWTSMNKDARAFSPSRAMTLLAERRHLPKIRHKVEEADIQVSAHRASARTLWAPFAGAACVAGVAPGGIGVPPLWVRNPTFVSQGERRLKLHLGSLRLPEYLPSATLLSMPSSGQQRSRSSYPSLSDWKRMLEDAATARPWLDQGISLTLPPDLPLEQLSLLVEQAWDRGLDCIRFAWI